MMADGIIEFQNVQREGPSRANRRRRAPAGAVAPRQSQRFSEANDRPTSCAPLLNPPKRLCPDVEEEPEEEPAIESQSRSALSHVKPNAASPEYAEQYNAPAGMSLPFSDGEIYQLFGHCTKCFEGEGQAADWHVEASGLPCRRQELQDAFRTGNASGVAKSLHRFMSESLQHGSGRHWGISTNHSSIWIEEYRRLLLPWISKLTYMGTYDCLSLAYRLLWKLKDLPQEPHLDEVRKARNKAGDVTSILPLPQDDNIDFQLYTVINKRGSNRETWAWEHDLAALQKQASLLTQQAPNSSKWFQSSIYALEQLGKQRAGLTSELLEPLPGFKFALTLDRGGLGVRKGAHRQCCADQVDQLA